MTRRELLAGMAASVAAMLVKIPGLPAFASQPDDKDSGRMIMLRVANKSGEPVGVLEIKRDAIESPDHVLSFDSQILRHREVNGYHVIEDWEPVAIRLSHQNDLCHEHSDRLLHRAIKSGAWKS